MALNTPPSTFTPASVSENPRAWKSDIGLMNTSTTNVVFTIESLIGFLKTHQVEVDSNYNEFKNLPKYASFGKMEAIQSSKAESCAPDLAQSAKGDVAYSTLDGAQFSSAQNGRGSASNNHQAPDPVEAATASSESATRPADVFIPTRKVRQAPGGGTLTIGNLFGGDDKPVPNKRVVSAGSSVLPEGTSSPADQGFIPSRKVREPPGGVSQISAIFG